MRLIFDDPQLRPATAETSISHFRKRNNSTSTQARNQARITQGWKGRREMEKKLTVPLIKELNRRKICRDLLEHQLLNSKN